MPLTSPTSSSTSSNSTVIGTIVSGINCDTIEYVQRYSPIVLLQILQFILSFTSVSFVIAARAIQQHTYFHPNVKVLMNTYHGAILMFGAAHGTAQMYHILTAMSYESCELLITCKLCFGFRLIITACVIAFSLLLFCIPIERSVATRNLGRGYENRKSSLGQFLSIIVMIFSICFATWYHWTDLTSRTCTHCIYDTRDLLPCGLMKFLMGVSTVSLVFAIVVLLFNMRKLKKKTYSLAIEFQINQNLRVLHLILPLSFTTFLSFTWFLISPRFFPITNEDAEINQFHKMIQNVFPVYSLLSSSIWLLMMFMEKKKKRVAMMPPEIRKDEKDVYFQSLNDQWSRMPSQKTGRLQILNVFSVPRSSVVA